MENAGQVAETGSQVGAKAEIWDMIIVGGEPPGVGCGSCFLLIYSLNTVFLGRHFETNGGEGSQGPSRFGTAMLKKLLATPPCQGVLSWQGDEQGRRVTSPAAPRGQGTLTKGTTRDTREVDPESRREG